MRVCLGGTFEFLHAGHQRLLTEALQTAGADGEIVIGLTSDAYAKKKGNVASFTDRKAGLETFLKSNRPHPRVRIVELFDRFGPALTEDFDAIVVSEETVESARDLNAARQRSGLRTLSIVMVPMVPAEDGHPISSTRIREGQVTADGRLRRVPRQ
jgi:pantetheine-phosphate adenylyltransferase